MFVRFVVCWMMGWASAKEETNPVSAALSIPCSFVAGWTSYSSHSLRGGDLQLVFPLFFCPAPSDKCDARLSNYFFLLAGPQVESRCLLGLALGTHPPTDLGPTHMVTRQKAFYPDLNLVVTLPLPNFVSYAAPLQSTN
jgi:hypothetical protein